MRLPRFGPAGFGTHLLAVDPKLQAPDRGDYHLAPGSPLVDAGVRLTAAVTRAACEELGLPLLQNTEARGYYTEGRERLAAHRP